MGRLGGRIDPGWQHAILKLSWKNGDEVHSIMKVVTFPDLTAKPQ